MDKRLKWFYRISIWLFAMLILSNILVKLIIWPFALRERKDEHQCPIMMHQKDHDIRYTTKIKEKLFNLFNNKIDYLFTPAFIMIFAVIAVKLVKTPEIFEEKD